MQEVPQTNIPMVKAKKKPVFKYFLAGFCSILILSGVFIGGYQYGRGAWVLPGGMQGVAANKGLPNSLDYNSVNNVYLALKQKYDGKLDEAKLVSGMKKGLVEAAGDPYTTYMDTEEAKSFDEQLSGSFSGIGAELGKKDNNIEVISPIAGFPAEKAGIKSKDIIVSIDGQDATGLNVDEAVKRIRGEKGTTVKLGIVRDGQLQEVSIVRDTITIPSVEYKILDGNIGYIKISRFGEDTASLVEKAAQEFKAKNVNGIILDMRNDPGGYLNAAVDVSSQWLKPGQTILQEKRDGKVEKSFKAETTGQLVGVPTVVLINGGSASASEITAGALKDNNAATIIGTTSYGKGSVQDVNRFQAGDMIKVTIARWFTPNDKNIDKAGIEPNIKVELSADDIKNSVDAQLNAAIAKLQK